MRDCASRVGWTLVFCSESWKMRHRRDTHATNKQIKKKQEVSQPDRQTKTKTRVSASLALVLVLVLNRLSLPQNPTQPNLLLPLPPHPLLSPRTRWHCTSLVRRAPTQRDPRRSALSSSRFAAVRKECALCCGLEPSHGLPKSGGARVRCLFVVAHAATRYTITQHIRHGHKMRQTSVHCFVMYRASFTPDLHSKPRGSSLPGLAEHCAAAPTDESWLLSRTLRAFFRDQTLLAGLERPAVRVQVGFLWLFWSGVVGGGGSMCALSMSKGRDVVTQNNKRQAPGQCWDAGC